jgi:hypothetical protein
MPPPRTIAHTAPLRFVSYFQLSKIPSSCIDELGLQVKSIAAVQSWRENPLRAFAASFQAFRRQFARPFSVVGDFKIQAILEIF